MDTRTTQPNIPTTAREPHSVGPLGVDLAMLADLPNDLRGRAIAALEELAAAVSAGNPDRSAKATQKLTAIIAEIQDAKASAESTKAFGNMRGTAVTPQTLTKLAG
ncbi:MAG TPA: hypothetical protein VHT03_06350 [Rhizomicrobium sp.]|jgi:hypothetical protein|nr:hypothetical protein [Rhizomicrobium sp.]